jgi:hypothetical protein
MTTIVINIISIAIAIMIAMLGTTAIFMSLMCNKRFIKWMTKMCLKGIGGGEEEPKEDN